MLAILEQPIGGARRGQRLADQANGGDEFTGIYRFAARQTTEGRLSCPSGMELRSSQKPTASG